MPYKIFYEKNPSITNINTLSKGLSEHADAMRGHIPIRNFAFFIHEQTYKIKGRVRGGCCGSMYYGCLYVDQLWVDEALRHQKYGTQLMHAAEELGRQEGCVFVSVATMDWEALDFYKKLGYSVEFERHGYLKDSVFYCLRKELCS